MHELTDLVGIRAACALFDRVWGPVDQPVMPVNLCRAIGHAGGYVVGASAGGELIGASVAFFGRDGAQPVLHSHITGAVPGVQGRGVGFALKLHQRAWSLERGVPVVVWTFDPLVARNAYFNLRKLGVVVSAYHPDFYGTMDDAYNGGDATDRCVATWQLDGVRAPAPESGGPRFHASGAVTVLDIDGTGRPVIGAGPRGAVLRMRTPTDYHALRQRDRPRADAWRLAVRDVLGGAIERGYVAVDADADGTWTLVRRERAEQEDAR